MKPRHHLYLDEVLTAELDRLGAKPGTSKSAIVADALRAFLTRRAASEIDDLFKLRLDRLSRQLGRIERDQKILLESLALFVRYQLTVTAPLPEADKAAQAIGRERFQRFVDQVGRQLASGRATLGADEGERGEAAP
jgi:predicted transcriptional regulator